MSEPTAQRQAVRVAIAGAGGRMGHMLIESALSHPEVRLAGAFDMPGTPGLGADAAAFLGKRSGALLSSDMAQGMADAEVLIDFTRPDGTLRHLEHCRTRGVAMVIGTTGFGTAQRAQIEAAARDIGIVFAPNMSVGVNVMLQLLAQAARALGDGYDIEIFEAHHRHKVDAPSGTALAMGEAVARARGQQLHEQAIYAREGTVGARKPGSIGFAALRGGDVVGEHSVWFAGNGERIEITHKSSSRANYAEGALRAACFVAGRPAGLYTMRDVLGMEPAR